MKFSIKVFFYKCDQIHRKLRIWSHLLKKSLEENFLFCTVYDDSMAFSPELLSCLLVRFIKCYPLPCLIHTKRYDFVFPVLQYPQALANPPSI